MPGKFIVFEGLDGSGQSTQTRLLAEFLTRKGREVVITKEPTGESEAGKKIREALAQRIVVTPRGLQELFAEDRQEHLERVILPALTEGKYVISDRYMFSSFAFGAIECDLEWLIELNREFPMPDLAFFLAISPEKAVSRIEKRGKPKELFEETEKLKKVDENYRKLLTRFPCMKLVNGEQSEEAVHAEVVKIVMPVLQ
ncbi:MAG: dTMP kinase [Candidatus Liptonbacteria bacterium]|nr:dTMP kinase [Candidatus Liptonbacteria bacterium]